MRAATPSLILLLSVFFLANVLSSFTPLGAYERSPELARPLVVPGSYATLPESGARAAQLFWFVPARCVRVHGSAWQFHSRMGLKATKTHRCRHALVHHGDSQHRRDGRGACVRDVTSPTLFITAGTDAFVAVATVLLGIAIGRMGSVTNPFSVGVPLGIGDIDLRQGLWVRIATPASLYAMALYGSSPAELRACRARR